MSTSKPPLTAYTWAWRMIAGRNMLVTETGGARVVLAPSRNGAIQTLNPSTGTLRDLRPEDAAARLIGAAPDLMRSLLEVLPVVTEHADPSVAGRARDALVKSSAEFSEAEFMKGARAL